MVEVEEGKKMNHRQQIDKLKARYESAKQQVKRDRSAVEDAEDYLASAEEARHIVQQVGQAVQQEAHDRLAGVVSKCLEAVFDEPYEFKIIFDKKRNQTEARLVFIRDGMEINPMDAAGGGVVDVASFALRLSSLMLKRPACRRLIVMDEPMKFVSAQYRPKLKALLESLAEKMDVQLIQVTHIPEMIAGKVVELG